MNQEWIYFKKFLLWLFKVAKEEKEALKFIEKERRVEMEKREFIAMEEIERESTLQKF